MTDNKDFSKTPVSMNEIRATKSDKASDWTPRDALIDLLREIDQGTLKPYVIFIAYGERTGKTDTRSGFSAAGPDNFTINGVVYQAQRKFNKA